MSGDSDSDAPEDLTNEQSIKQNEEIENLQRESSIRAAKEGKERRRRWAQRRTTVKPSKEGATEVTQTEEQQEARVIPGMLPSNIVDLLAAREKQVFTSDSEEEIVNHKPVTKKKKQQVFGPETVILSDIPPADCLQKSMDFLKKRKAQVARSPSILKNANQALRLLSSRGSLLSKS